MADGKHLLFVSRPTGYVLVERDGEPPQRGSRIDLEDGGGSFVVSKLGPSPLPHDDRPCAYLQAAI
jgi:hypothetical protein